MTYNMQNIAFKYSLKQGINIGESDDLPQGRQLTTFASKAKKKGNFKFGGKGTGATPLPPPPPIVKSGNPKTAEHKGARVDCKLCALRVCTLRWLGDHENPIMVVAWARIV